MCMLCVCLQLVEEENVRAVLSYNEWYELQFFTNSKEVYVWGCCVCTRVCERMSEVVKYWILPSNYQSCDEKGIAITAIVMMILYIAN